MGDQYTKGWQPRGVERMLGHNIMSRDDDKTDSRHAVCLAKVRHSDGTEQEVVEVYERHGDKRARRVFDLATVVHWLLNLETDEEFEIEQRYLQQQEGTT